MAEVGWRAGRAVPEDVRIPTVCSPWKHREPLGFLSMQGGNGHFGKHCPKPFLSCRDMTLGDAKVNCLLHSDFHFPLGPVPTFRITSGLLQRCSEQGPLVSGGYVDRGDLWTTIDVFTCVHDAWTLDTSTCSLRPCQGKWERYVLFISSVFKGKDLRCSKVTWE